MPILTKQNKCLVLIFACLLFILPKAGHAEQPLYAGDRNFANSVKLNVKVSPDSQFSSSLIVNDGGILKREILGSSKVNTERKPEIPLAYVHIADNNGKFHDYILSYSYNLFDEQNKTMLQLSSSVKERLKHYLEILNARHFGAALSWNEARNIFQRKKNAMVVDVETGKSFMVQRRAGSNHADVQPLTKIDTKVMKEIYGGKWSWKRRAILVEVDGKKIAASMNGMPHGAGAIRDNNFPGHFCIHFRGSTTHRSNQADPGHDLMVEKASGEMMNTIYHASPEQLVYIFFTALNEQDFPITNLTLDQRDIAAVSRLQTGLKEIAGVRSRLIQADDSYDNMDTDDNVDRQVTEFSRTEEEQSDETPEQKESFMLKPIPVSVTWYTTDHKEYRKHITVWVRRDFFFNRWKIIPDSIAQLWQE